MPAVTPSRRLVGIALAILTTIAVAGVVAVGPLPPRSLPQGLAALAQAELGQGQVMVGASRISLLPRPDDYAEEFPGATWLQGEENRGACTTLSPSLLQRAVDDPVGTGHMAVAGPNPWPENPDCLYMGGFGIGPMNPILDWDRAPGDAGFAADDDPSTGMGLWVRTTAISDGTDTTVLTVLDTVGYLYDYASKCQAANRPGCGAGELAEGLGAELGFDPGGMVVSATHAHSSPDLMGGWGFVPDWYFAQVVDSIRDSVREAVAAMQPAILEIGEEEARAFNRERRDTYRSAEEQQLTWIRAVAPGRGQGAQAPQVIATIGGYAAHPTSYGTNGGTAHADWVGVFTRRLEERFGGLGMHLMTGLGNMSNATGRTGSSALADLIPPVGEGVALTDTDVRADAVRWQQPVTNVPLTALGLPGFFDRSFVPEPAAITTGQSPQTAPCQSQSAVSVELQASAIRIGDQLALTAAPGEVFANLTNTLKEQSGSLVTMPLGQANDALGYMPQQFEINEVGQQGLGFALGGVLVVNYEDSYAIDRCTGDKVLEDTIGLLAGLAAP